MAKGTKQMAKGTKHMADGTIGLADETKRLAGWAGALAEQSTLPAGQIPDVRQTATATGHE
jgi:hypothetical protein